MPKERKNYTIEPKTDSYGIMPLKIYDDERRTYNATLVWGAICSFAKWRVYGKDHIELVEGSCVPSLSEIAGRAHCSVATVKKGIRQLENMGYITIVKRSGSTNEYILSNE